MAPNRGAVCMALATLVACSNAPALKTEAPRSISPPQASSSPVLPTISSRLLKPPEGCAGPAPHPTPVSPEFAPLVGKPPLWAGFYAALNERTATYSAADAPRTDHGWRIKVLWVIKPMTKSVVRVHGSNRKTGEPMWFAIGGEGSEPVTEAVMDPAAPSVTDPTGFNQFTSYVFFPRAGCYSVSVASDQGGWSLGFGFGR